MKLGVIGAGNMGGAIIRGYAAALQATGEGKDVAARAEILVFDTDEAKTAALSTLANVYAARDLQELADGAEIIIIAVKPGAFDTLTPQIADCVKWSDSAMQPVFVSIAAGISIGYLRGVFGQESAIIRVMPNTPAMVGAGMTAIARGANVPDDAYAEVCRIFESFGEVAAVDDSQMDAVTGISGSSPAYAYMYMQALIECGVENGLNEAEAKLLAAQATLGAAKMVLEGGDDPEQLRINVCSPGGTTIEAVRVLEEQGFMDTVKAAMNAAAAKSKQMTR
ncbi:MAG: pyrroline-5-carboxylate reductase [Clostridiales Family XIII bacterium]|nr:pyrroline-5-carboxylate reductase [Clostridiales Family XIII bacterium]